MQNGLTEYGSNINRDKTHHHHQPEQTAVQYTKHALAQGTLTSNWFASNSQDTTVVSINSTLIVEYPNILLYC